MGVFTGAILSAVIGVGGSMYASKEAEKQQKEAQARADAAALAAEKRRQDEAGDARPEGETATFLPGTGDGDDDLGSYNDFLTPRMTNNSLGGSADGSGVSASSGSGLGFNV